MVAIGYVIEAVTGRVEHLFRRHNARRLYTYVETTNLPSARLCEKLGIRREGIFRAFVSFTTEHHGHPIDEDTMQYALLRSEWEQTHPGEPSSHP